MWAQLAEASGDSIDAAFRARAERAAQLPMQPFARPNEVASAAIFLTDPKIATSPASALTSLEVHISGWDPDQPPDGRRKTKPVWLSP